MLALLHLLACGGANRTPPPPAPPRVEPPAAPFAAGAGTAAGEEQPKFVFFDPEVYAEAAVEGLAGTAVCAECHEDEYRHWLRTPHARALADATGPDGAAVVSCRRCHASLVLSPGEDAERLRLDLGGVGCEACHGPGQAHAEDPESFAGQISGVRDDCPECNFRGLCQVCHNTEGDPDFKYFAAYRLVRHPEPGEEDQGGEIPLQGTGGPACERGANR